MKKRLLLIQPGRHGDIVICLPIAEYYSREYRVAWLCPPEFHSNFRNISYCSPVAAADREAYDRVVDIGFGFGASNEVDAWWVENLSRYESFVSAKYALAEVPLEQRWNLHWNRDIDREERLFHELVKVRDYVLFQDRGSTGPTLEFALSRGIKFEPVGDYNVFDWYKIIVHAKAIYCIDSLLCNFVEVLPEARDIQKFLYRVRNTETCLDTLVKNNWKILSFRGATAP
jgi:hypothetical protein